MIITGLDLETTGLEPEKGHRIIEVACILYDWPSRAEKLRVVQRVNPARSIDAKAQAVHRITLAELASEPLWEAVAPTVSKVLGASQIVVGHNFIHFDGPFVAMELDRVGQPVPAIKCVDTMVDGRWACPDGKSPRLGELCWALDVPYDPTQAHGALYDVSIMMQCFWKGLDMGFFKLPE